MKKVIFILILFRFVFNPVFGQEITDVDSAFLEAKQLAYDDSTRSKAMELCYKILEKSPDYTDVNVLLARIYYWNNQTDSARNLLKAVILKNPYEDAYIAIADIERWEGNYELSLEYSIKGIEHFGKSEELFIRKARALHGLKLKEDTKRALDTLKILTGLNPYEDSYVAIADIERWEGNYANSLEYSVRGLENFKTSEELCIRRAYALYKLKFKDDALKVLDSLLKVDTSNVEAKKLVESINNPEDSTFNYARKLAIQGSYDSAEAICKKILKESPDYEDFRVLLAKIFYWNKDTDSARYELKYIIDKEAYEDAYITISDIERWQGNDTAALDYASTGLDSFPKSEDLLIRKARCLWNLDRNDEAYHLLDSLLRVDGNNDEARQLAESIKRTLAINSIQIAYYYDFFNRQFSNPWDLVSLQYEHYFKHFGSVIWRVNWASRFGNTGRQFEMDAYPNISKKMYMYLNAGYSFDNPIFPQYRFGASLYRSLPKSFEAEIGFRWMYFNNVTYFNIDSIRNSGVPIYVASVGKYYKDFWFSLRGTFVFNYYGPGLSQAYNLITRYYGKSVNDYWNLTLGYGISPDDLSPIDLSSNPPAKAYRIYLGDQISYKYYNIFFFGGGVTNYGYYYLNHGPGFMYHGDDFYFNMGYQRIF